MNIDICARLWVIGLAFFLGDKPWKTRYNYLYTVVNETPCGSWNETDRMTYWGNKRHEHFTENQAHIS